MALSAVSKKKTELHSSAALRIVQEAVRPDCSAADLADLAATDPAFAMRLLSLVNSPVYALANPITSVHRASALIGVRGLRNAALGLVVNGLAPPNDFGRELLAAALRRATAAALIGRAAKAKDVDTFFTIGLLLEAGLLQLAHEATEVLADAIRGPARQRPLKERALGLTPHPGRGAALAARFGLGQDAQLAIAEHHLADFPSAPLSRVTWMAERLATLFEGADYSITHREVLEAAGAMGMNTQDVDQIIDHLPQALTETATALDWDLAEAPELQTLMEDANARLVEINAEYESIVRTLERVIAEKEALAERLECANRELEHLAATDPLTGLANKRAFVDSLDRDLARCDREGTAISVAMIDVDHFKSFNDTWGHAAGDAALRRVAQVMQELTRASDLVARYGGEEFVVVMPNTDLEGAAIVAERIRKGLPEAPIEGMADDVRVTASLGVASIRGPGCRDAASSLMERADSALYVAKGAGRNRVSFAD